MEPIRYKLWQRLPLSHSEIEIIDEALKKQIAQKPIPLVTLDGDIYLCNECESDLSPDDKYCHECGTKIDWSEEE